MNPTRMVYTVDSHTDGGATRVILSGYGTIPGETLLKKKQYVESQYDNLRGLLVNEPRGGGLMTAVLVLEPSDKSADVAVIIMDSSGYPPMCGHCMIGVATTLVETGLVQREEPVTNIIIETEAGLVTASVSVHEANVGPVTLDNVPSYVAERDVSIDLPDGTNAAVDITYGGQYYACVRAADVRVRILNEHAAELEQVGDSIRGALAGKVITHPTIPHIDSAYNVLIYEPLESNSVRVRSAVICPSGSLDRSPCGTGTSALMAHLSARGELEVGQTLVNEGILGAFFSGRILGAVAVGTYSGIRSEVTGRAYITGFHHFMLDSHDPFPAGYVIGRPAP